MKNKSVLFSLCVVLTATIGIVMLSSGINAQKAPSVKTNPVKNITATSAQSGYVITAAGVTITKHGICMSKGPGPTTKNTVYGADKAPGPSFNVQLTGLTPGMKLYIRSFITTSTETIYGNEISFTTLAKK
ncbi:MAG: hypothetical protein Q7U54_00595 [Bacteroidales bacterium]|nr:hypothetical protein [Bacteroidales bacterium]